MDEARKTLEKLLEKMEVKLQPVKDESDWKKVENEVQKAADFVKLQGVEKRATEDMMKDMLAYLRGDPSPLITELLAKIDQQDLATTSLADLFQLTAHTVRDYQHRQYQPQQNNTTEVALCPSQQPPPPKE